MPNLMSQQHSKTLVTMVNLLLCLDRPYDAINNAYTSLSIPKATLVIPCSCEKGLDLESHRG